MKPRDLWNRQAGPCSTVSSAPGSTRRVTRILRAALTNDPALYLKAVAAAGGASHGTAGPLRLSEGEFEVCRRMGLDPARFQTTRDGEAEDGQ